MNVIFWILMVLGMITLVGHGIWVMLTGFFRMLGSGVPRPIQARLCPRCGAAWDERNDFNGCALCGWPSEIPRRRTERGVRQILRDLEERVERYHHLGLITTESRDRLVRAFRDDPRPVAPLLAPPPAPIPVAEVAFLEVSEPVLEPVGEAPEAQPAAPAGDAASRMRSYLDFLDKEATQGPAPAPSPAPVPLAAPEPSQRMLTLLAAFLEQKNIRWGEIVGGLLIVGCSLALVLSFWSSIAERPLLKFGLFTGVTALLFGLGLHAERRWRLPTTALGLLVIATLLIPLNFLAVASLSRGAVAETVGGVAGELVTVALFAALTYLAGRSLVSRAPAALTVGVLVPSTAMLLIRRYVDPGAVLAAYLAFGAAPLLAQGGAVGTLIRRVRREPEIDEPLALDLLRLLGLTTFAVALALGLLLAQGGPVAASLHRAAPLAPLAGASALATGLLIWRRTVAADLAGYRTAGTAIAAAGVLVMLAGAALTWPDPAGMIPVALLDGAVLMAVAFAFEVPGAHVLAGACLTLAYLLAWHLAAGTLGWTGGTPAMARDALLSSRSGSALLPIELLFGAAAAFGLRRGRRLDAQAFAMVAALAAAFSLGLITWFGFGRPGDPAGLGVVYALHAIAALAAAAWFGRDPLVAGTDGRVEAGVLGWAGSALVLASLVQGLVFGGWIPGLPSPWIAALLLHASAGWGAASLLATLGGDRSPTGTHLRNLLTHSALATSLVAAGWLALGLPFAASTDLAAALAWLALVWLALSWRYVSPALFAASQAALTGSLVFAVAALLGRRGWYAASPSPWLDPWSLQAQAIAVGVLCLVWIGARLVIRRQPPKSALIARRLLDPPWPPFDRFLRVGLLLALAGLALYGALPGAARELWPRDQAGWLPDVANPSAAIALEHARQAHAIGVGSWVLLALVLLLLLAGQWERFRGLDLIGALVAGSMAVPLLAGRWEPDVATASALRWAGAVFLMAAAALIWSRGLLARGAVRLGWRIEPGEAGGLDRLATGTVLVLWLLPLLSVTISVVGSELAGNPIVGPAPGTFFARIGLAGSYVPPMLLVAATLLGYAVRERSSAFAFAAGLMLNLAASVGYLLAGVAAGRPLDVESWTRLALLDAIVASATALIWMDAVAVWRRGVGEEGGEHPDPLLSAMMALGLGLDVLVLIAGTAALFLSPLPGGMNLAIAGPWGWSAMVLSAVTAFSWARRSRRAIPPDGLGLGLLGAADFLALGLAVRDRGDWLTYHGVMAGQAVAAVFLVLAAWRHSGLHLPALAEDVRAAVVRWATVALSLVVLFALRAYWSDPRTPWWTVGGLACMVPLAATLAVWSRRPSFLAFAGVLLNLAVTCWWCATPRWLAPGAGTAETDLLNVNVIALALPAPLWLWIHRKFLRPGAGDGWPWVARVERVPFQRVAAWIALVMLALVVTAGLANDAAEGGVRPGVWLGWGALAAATIAMAAGLWDDRSRATVAGLYVLGLCAAGWSVHQYHLPFRMLAWIGTIVLSAYSVMTSYLWSRRAALRSLADRLGIARPDADDPIADLAWLAPANLGLAVGVLALAFDTITTEPDALRRSLAAHAALAEVLATGLLAHGERRLRLQLVALAVGVVGALAWGWAWIAPDSPTLELDRLVVLLVALVGAAALYGLGLTKLMRKETEWTGAARRLVPTLLWLGGVALAAVIGAEVLARNEGRDVAMSFASIAAVAATLVAAGAAGLVAALVPGRDPLGLSERGRTAYVYGCEVLVGLLVLHLRLTMPWLFSGFFARYRPFVVLTVAFLGVGLGELFRRQGRMVLAEPLERTGALLPVLPLLGAFWVEPRPGEDTLFLVFAGVLYTVLSLLRSSLAFGALAALAYNGALWVLLGRQQGLGLLEHPQLWVIPPALCTLIGAYLNRDRLSESQITSIRYATCLAIYVSSTGDIVLTGVAQAPWLPLVLGALSLVGIFAGIVLRVRGFLFLGLGFLGLSLFTIIWYAAVDLRQTWLWSASGIVAGILILALFALFEKKRQEVLHVVDQFREWNA